MLAAIYFWMAIIPVEKAIFAKVLLPDIRAIFVIISRILASV